MRLPRDKNNWTTYHAEKAIAAAEKLFEKYERLYDADKREYTDDLYLQFLHAKQEAVDVAMVVEVKSLIARAKNLG